MSSHGAEVDADTGEHGSAGAVHHDKKEKKPKKDKATRMKEKEAELAQQVDSPPQHRTIPHSYHRHLSPPSR